jgi:molybdate transport system substrate-binding protein
MKTTFVIAAALALFATSASAEVKLFGGGHFQASGKNVAEAFTKKTGIAATYTPGNTGNNALKRRLDAGEKMDVIVMNSDEIAEQADAGLIKKDSIKPFALDRMAFAVKKGAPKPDISTPAKLKAVLMSAKAVGMQEPDPAGHSGANILAILNKLGIKDDVMKKAVIIKDPATDLTSGKVDISFWSHPELTTRTDVDLVGPAPAELGATTEQSVGVLTSASNDADARAFIRYLTSPDAAPVYQKTGLDPLPKR